ncbi:hypothetical protein B4144_2382 [Bacillus atrophaeus]|nr:hypothetical protein B4144_2382 [Bacillus atrophaeus]
MICCKLVKAKKLPDNSGSQAVEKIEPSNSVSQLATLPVIFDHHTPLHPSLGQA